MIILDKALQRRQEEGRPIKVGIVGAGFMGRPVARRLINDVPGIQLVGVANRTVERAAEALREIGVDATRAESVEAVEAAAEQGTYVVTDDPHLLCAADGIDIILEVTGAVDFGARVVLDAIEHGKHILLMNAELDGTVGPLLKAKADAAGVMYGNVDGDQPGVIMNLYRFVEGLGCTTKLLGNIKGLQDPYRNPTTQQGFAERWGQTPSMVTSFADGTKVNFEMAIVANNTGFTAAKRGLYQPEVPAGTPIEEIADYFPVDKILESDGIVDYCVGASPGPGVFALATHPDPLHQHYLNLYKLGEGPLYVFYTPYHLCHFEVPTSIVRMVDFADAPVAPIGAPVVEVVALAKAALEAGTIIDGLGEYLTYGEAENHLTARQENLLPIALAEGARVKGPLAKNAALTLDDVELADRLIVDLWHEQLRHFEGQPVPESLSARA
ncbi:MAG TPA: Gfo/Idh/MocA family oxidoreductase [Acidimicrobiales bacterium]